VSVISAVFILILGKEVSEWIGSPSLEKYLWLVPIVVLVHGTHQSLRQWKSREREFSNMALSSVSEIIIKKVYQIFIGILGFASGLNLIIAGIVATILRNLVLLYKLRDVEFKVINAVSIKKALVRYKKFPIYTVWGDLFSRLPAIIIAIMIVKYFGQEMLGHYGLSLMVLSLPFVLISGSIMEAFIPRVAMAKHDGKHIEMFEKLYIRLVVLMVFPFIVLWHYSGILFPFVFGDNWTEAGIIAQVLIVKILFEIIFSPSLSLINVMEKQQLQVIRSVSSSLVTAIALLIGNYYSDFYMALWIIVCFEALSITIIGGYMMNIINFKFLHIMKKMMKHMLIIVLFYFVMENIKLYYNSVNFELLLIIIAISSCYYLLMLFLDKELQQYLRQLMQIIKK
jgi:lipopolysaccharide exporter